MRVLFIRRAAVSQAMREHWDDAKVTEVHEKDGELLHYTDKALEVGTKVEGKIDWVRRFD